MKILWSVLLVLFVAGVVEANFTALNSSQAIEGPAFTFDEVDTGWVNDAGGLWRSANDGITRAHGFEFGNNSSGEYITATSEGSAVGVLGDPFGFDGRVVFRFENLVAAAGIDFDTGTELSLVAYDNNMNAINTDGSITGAAHSTGFFGIASDIQNIRYLEIHDSAGTFQLDNLRFGGLYTTAAPVPAALGLGIVGLGMVGLTMRRKKR